MILRVDIKILLDELIGNINVSDKRIKELLSLLNVKQKCLLREYSITTISSLRCQLKRNYMVLNTTMKYIDENKDIYHHLKIKQIRGLICFNKYKFLGSDEILFLHNYKKARKLITGVLRYVESETRRIKHLYRLLNFM